MASARRSGWSSATATATGRQRCCRRQTRAGTVELRIPTVAASLQPLTDAIAAHVRAGHRIHADETPVPVLAKGKTPESRLWTIVRDGRPFGGPHLQGTGPPPPPPSTRPIAAACTPSGSSQASSASCRPMRSPVSAACTNPAAPLARLSRLRAGATRAGASSNSPSCKKGRSRSKRCGGSTKLFAIEREINGLSAGQQGNRI